MRKTMISIVFAFFLLFFVIWQSNENSMRRKKHINRLYRRLMAYKETPYNANACQM